MENMSLSKETFIDRLEAFMKMEKLNANSLTVRANLSNGLVNKALKNRSSMNSDSIERILNAYPHINASWLMTGKGTMYVEELPKTTDYISNAQNNDSLVFFLRDRNKELECENRKLLSENASLRTRLELLDNSTGKTG
ncbi:hypothetical protein NXV35_21450 [Bacteroides faecis]|jgi:hypothetical protein|nr:hypothetical protein [Bacteroides faecis]